MKPSGKKLPGKLCALFSFAVLSLGSFIARLLFCCFRFVQLPAYWGSESVEMAKPRRRDDWSPLRQFQFGPGMDRWRTNPLLAGRQLRILRGQGGRSSAGRAAEALAQNNSAQCTSSSSAGLARGSRCESSVFYARSPFNMPESIQIDVSIPQLDLSVCISV